jgi:carbon monoxide dehydrogenase subunit G
MIDKTDKISDTEITEEDLLDFELDDLSSDDLVEGTKSGESDDDILELVDLVEEGKRDKLKDSFEGEIADLVNEDEDITAPTAKISDMEEISDKGEPLEEAETELDLSDISLTDLAAEAEAQPATMLDEEEIAEVPIEEGMEELPTAAIEMDFDMEEEVPEEGVEEEHITEVELEKMLETEPVEEPILDLESPIEEGLDLPQEEVSEVVAAQPEPPQPVEAALEPAGGEVVGISEEKLEALVTKVVEDVVQSVARETMGSVAEKVARETMANVAESVARETMERVAESVARETMASVAESVARETMGSVAESVARETMASVAERVITEAVDALKESLESVSD